MIKPYIEIWIIELATLAQAPTSIFISYKREDETFARHLHHQLRAWGYNVWLDVLDLHPGNDWDSSIHKAMEAAQIVIGVITPASLASRNVLDEWGYALSNNKTLLLLWLKDVPEEKIPPRYIRIERIDFRHDPERGLKRLYKALTGIPGPVPITTPTREFPWMLLGLIALGLTALIVAGVFILGNNGKDPIAEESATATATATLTETQLPVPTAPATSPEVIFPTVLPTLTNIPTVTPSLTETATPTGTPTATPAATNTLRPNSTSVQAYPCDGQVIFRTGAKLNAVHLSPGENAPLRSPIQQGSNVTIQGEMIVLSQIWFQIIYSNGSDTGWILSEYIIPDSSCP